MINKINLYWYKHKKGYGNFGDELNPYIIQKISNVSIRHVDIEYIKKDLFLAIKILTHDFVKGKISFVFFTKYVILNVFVQQNLFLAIGSVLQFCKTKNALVWGSGMLSSKSMLPDAKYLAVRGFKTIKRLNELGYNAPKVVGDPALLLPLLYKKTVEKKFKIGIIPHYLHYHFYNNQSQEDIKVINLSDKIEDIIDQINECELTICTSLHGIVVSHAYGVKSVWATEERIKLSGDDIKFSDYFSSVLIRDYLPITLHNHASINAEKLLGQITNDYNDVLLPNENIIHEIQKDLLSVFPFEKKAI